jgi:uncharacterized repeat protein (TIGR04076 family)
MSYRILINVREVKGKCPIQRVGDKIEVIGDEVKGNICAMAFHTIFPYIFAMQYGANFPWLENKDEILAYCPDPMGLVLFEIKRIK